MDSRLLEAILRNDTSTFTSLVGEDEGIIEQRTADSFDTTLHLASKFGHTELVMEIVKLRPEMTTAMNKKMETPLHEACRHGNTSVLRVLLDANPWVAHTHNYENQSALFIACSNGHLDVVKLFKNLQPWLLVLEEGRGDLNALNVAASRGQTDIVRNILDIWPNLAKKIDQNGFSPLHYACRRGNLKTTKMLLSVAPDLILHFNNNGYTPLHLAAMNEDPAILEEFLSMDPASFEILTKGGETVFHLTVRFNIYRSFLILVQAFNATDLICRPDQYGNTILHLSVYTRQNNFTEYIINQTTVDINYQNYKRLTVLDILYEGVDNYKSRNFKGMLEKAGGKRSHELSVLTEEVKGINPLPLTLVADEVLRILLKSLNKGINSKVVSFNHEVEEKPKNQESDSSDVDQSSSKQKESTSSPKLHRHKHLNQRHKKELKGINKSRHNHQHDIYREAQQNARNTITLVAILIATVTFSAGINPPGGVYQEGPLIGMSIMGRKTAFKVFTISNDIALFTSLCIVIVLVSIIPFRRKTLMKLLVVAHKVMWVAVSFMAIAYVAATRVIMPQGRGTVWVFGSLLSICAGTIGSVFICLGVMLAKHWLRKLKWRKEKGRGTKISAGIKVKNQSPPNSDLGSAESDEYNSDVGSALSDGYHTY